MLSDAIHAEPGAAGGAVLEALNAVAVSPAQLQAALEILAALPQSAKRAPLGQALALRAYAREAGLGDDPVVSAALHARITALANWTAAHDPDRQSDAQAVIAATARYPMSDLAGGIGFDPAGFQEMILFVEELPW